MDEENAPRPMVVDCPDCDQPVIGEPVGYTTYYDPRGGTTRAMDLAPVPKWHPLLVLQNEYSGSGLTYNDDAPWRVYPPQDRQLSDEIPAVLRQAHQEARKWFGAKAYKATVAMSGRTIEGACKLHGVTKGTLQNQLAEMKTRELIDGRLWEWAESLRDVRNAASHFNDEEVSRQDADDSLAFSEALLDYLYLLSARFDALKARRSNQISG